MAETVSVEISWRIVFQGREELGRALPLRETWNRLLENYQQSLFKRKQQIEVIYKDELLMVELEGVDESGRLIVKEKELGLIHASFEELKWNY